MSTVIEIEVNKLIPAEWNYKTDGTDKQIEKLTQAIKEIGSYGVLPVREIDSAGVMLYEVIDGNHRLKAIQTLGYPKVLCENFGAISKARAVVISRQRNEQWFEDNRLKLASLMTEVVFPEFPITNLVNILPESKEDLQSYQDLSDIEWFDKGHTTQAQEDKKNPITEEPPAEELEGNRYIVLSPQVFDKWMNLRNKIERSYPELQNDDQCMELLLKRFKGSNIVDNLQ